MTKISSTIVILLFITQMSFAQYQIGLVPRISPDRAVYQKVGYTEIEIKYGSPKVDNRQLWGDLIPYNKVWRAGANNATTVEISDAITINEMSLDSGKYALFILPKENDKWTVIFNKVHQQWGAFKYDEQEDALRTEVIPRKTLFPTENLTYSIQQLGYQYGSIVLNWDDLEIAIPFETNYLEKFAAAVETRASTQPDYLKWIVYLQGAAHLEELKHKTDLGLSWINQAEQIMEATEKWNEQFYPRDYVKGHLYWTKAKLLAQSERYQEATAYVQKMKSLDDLMFYNRKKEVEDIEQLVELWGGQ